MLFYGNQYGLDGDRLSIFNADWSNCMLVCYQEFYVRTSQNTMGLAWKEIGISVSAVLRGKSLNCAHHESERCMLLHCLSVDLFKNVRLHCLKLPKRPTRGSDGMHQSMPRIYRIVACPLTTSSSSIHL